MLFIMNGYPTSGKTTFAEIFKKHSNRQVIIASSVDKIKEFAYSIGWDGKKTEEARRLLFEVKKLTVSFNNYPIKYAEELIKDNDVVFYDSREWREVSQLEEFDKSLSICIKNKSGSESLCASVEDIEKYKYDIYLENNSTLEEWEKKAIAFSKIKFRFKTIRAIDMDTNTYESNKYITISGGKNTRTIKYDDRKECLSDIVNGFIEKELKNEIN